MNNQTFTSLSFAENAGLSLKQKTALAAVGFGFLLQIAAFFGAKLPNAGLLLTISLLSIGFGTVAFAYDLYKHKPEGISNNGLWHNSLTNRGVWAWILGILLTGFYILLYWYPE